MTPSFLPPLPLQPLPLRCPHWVYVCYVLWGGAEAGLGRQNGMCFVQVQLEPTLWQRTRPHPLAQKQLLRSCPITCCGSPSGLKHLELERWRRGRATHGRLAGPLVAGKVGEQENERRDVSGKGGARPDPGWLRPLYPGPAVSGATGRKTRFKPRFLSKSERLTFTVCISLP